MKLNMKILRSILNYDPKTGILTSKIKRGIYKKGDIINGHLDEEGYLRIGINYKLYKAHKIIYMYMMGFFPIEVDHINKNRSDNRWINLRACTNKSGDNSQNRTKQNNKTSIYMGVSYHKRAKKWQANIKINGKNMHLGYFNTELEAKNAYDEAKLKYHSFQPVQTYETKKD